MQMQCNALQMQERKKCVKQVDSNNNIFLDEERGKKKTKKRKKEEEEEVFGVLFERRSQETFHCSIPSHPIPSPNN